VKVDLASVQILANTADGNNPDFIFAYGNDKDCKGLQIKV
jgi:hypothetical protein